MNRRRIFTIIQVGNLSDMPSRAYDFSLVIAVALNIFIAIFDTFPQADPYERIIWWVECITVVFFAVDYILRIWTADFLYEDISPGKARIRFIFTVGTDLVLIFFHSFSKGTFRICDKITVSRKWKASLFLFTCNCKKITF